MALERQQLRERGVARLAHIGQDHLLHDREPVALHEHVLGAAQPDARRAQLARAARVAGRVGVRPHAHALGLVGPGKKLRQPRRQLGRRRDQLQFAQHHFAGRAVDREQIALAQRFAGDRRGLRAGVDPQRFAAADGRFAHAAGHDRGVRGRAAARGEHALRGDDAVHVVGSGLGAHQDDRFAGFVPLDRGIGIEDDRAGSGAGRRVEPFRDRLIRLAVVDAGVKELVERGGADAAQGLVAVDEPFAHHVEGDLDRGFGAALAVARLQHVELAALDGELEVLHVAVVRLELVRDFEELTVDVGRDLVEVGDLFGRARAGDDVLTLRVAQVLAEDSRGARCWGRA